MTSFGNAPPVHSSTRNGRRRTSSKLRPSDRPTRDYSPFALDRRAGTFDLLVHVHGETPGARWARDVRAGELTHVFGPRSSLGLGALRGPVVLFGDETSFAVSRSLDERRGHVTNLACVFEVGDVADAEVALHDIGLRGSRVVARSTDDGHRVGVERAVRELLFAHPDAHLVMTGAARSIQDLRTALRREPLSHAGQKTKAYWAPGKRGLD